MPPQGPSPRAAQALLWPCSSTRAWGSETAGPKARVNGRRLPQADSTPAGLSRHLLRLHSIYFKYRLNTTSLRYESNMDLEKKSGSTKSLMHVSASFKAMHMHAIVR